MLRSILWTVLFIAVLAVSAFGLLILLVSGKEGGETWQLATGVGVFFVLLVIWWKLAPGFTGRYNCTLSVLGKAVLTTLFLFFTGMATPYVLASIQGPRLEQKVAIENFKETPIEWPGFTGPVGVRLEWDLVHPFHKLGALHPPKIWMGTSKRFDLPNAYFSLDRHYFAGKGDTAPHVRRLSILETLPFGPVESSAGLLTSEGRTHVFYDLYPKNLVHLESPDKLCLNRDSFPINTSLKAPVYHQGEDLSALWFFAGSSNLTIDLSPALTDVLRKQSRMQGKREQWKAMQKRFQPAGLRNAGYDPCSLSRGNLDHLKGRLCFCKLRPGITPPRRLPPEVPQIKPKGMATLNAEPDPQPSRILKKD